MFKKTALSLAMLAALHVHAAIENDREALIPDGRRLKSQFDFDQLRKRFPIALPGQKEKVFLSKDIYPTLREWLKERLVEPSLLGTKDLEWHSEARQFLISACDWWAWVLAEGGESENLGFQPNEETIDLLSKLEDAKCDVAAVWLLSYEIHKAIGQESSSFNAIGRASALAVERKLPPTVAALIATASFDARRSGVVRGLEIGTKAVDWIRNAISKENCGERDAMCLLRAAAFRIYGIPNAAGRELVTAISASDLPEWVKQAMLGLVEDCLAFNAPDEGWKAGESKNREHRQRAYTHLSNAWKLNPRDPVAPSLLSTIVIRLGVEDESPMLWFTRSVSAQMDYDAAYRRMFLSLSPPTHGNFLPQLAFADACLSTERFDTKVPGYFLDILVAVADAYAEDWRDIFRDPAIAVRLQRLAKALAASNEKPSVKGSGDATVAVCYWLSGSYGEAAPFFRAESISPSSKTARILQDLGVDVKRVAGESLALGEGSRADFVSYLKSRAEKRWEVAKSSLAAATSKVHAKASEFLHGERESLEFEETFASGNWVPIPIRESLPGWDIRRGPWRCEEEGKLLFSDHQGFFSKMILSAQTGVDFEMRGKFLLSGRDGNSARLSVIFGHPDAPIYWNENKYWAADFECKLGANMKVYQSVNGLPSKQTKSLKMPAGVVEFQLKVGAGTIRIDVDGNTVLETAPLTKLRESEQKHERIGFEVGYATEKTELEIFDLEIRRAAKPAE